MDAIDVTAIKTLYALLEEGYSVHKMVDALESGHVRCYDDFGRHISPRQDDVRKITDAIREYLHFDDIKRRGGQNIPPECAEYFRGYQQVLCGNIIDFLRAPVLARSWLDSNYVDLPGYGTPLSDAARLTRESGKNQKKQAEKLKARELATPIIQRGAMRHNDIARHLTEMTDADGRKIFDLLSQAQLISIIKDLCRELGREDLIRGITKK
ncbi:MAG: hypothetical protein JJU48_05515 [Methylophaga sp.]|nr:hypothetical protein [Methylophaga sp.]